MEEGLFENVGLTDDEVCNVKKVLLVVLMYKQYDNKFFKEWMAFSENVIKKVKMMWRNVL